MGHVGKPTRHSKKRSYDALFRRLGTSQKFCILLKNSATWNAYGMYNIVSLHLTIAFVHDIFVYICISLGVVDALNAATTSSLAFIHRRGLRVVSF